MTLSRQLDKTLKAYTVRIKSSMLFKTRPLGEALIEFFKKLCVKIKDIRQNYNTRKHYVKADFAVSA